MTMLHKVRKFTRSIPPISPKRTITSHLNCTHSTQKTQQHMTLEIQVLAWDRHKNVAGLNWLMGSQPWPLDTADTACFLMPLSCLFLLVHVYRIVNCLWINNNISQLLIAKFFILTTSLVKWFKMKNLTIESRDTYCY